MSEAIIACIGKLNALHRGHRALVESAARCGVPLLISFADIESIMGWQPRRPLLDPAERQRVLTSWSAALGRPVREQRLPFAAIRPLDAGAFLDHLRQQLGIAGLVCGPDFRCGRDRHADIATLAPLAAARGLSLTVADPVLHQGRPISSSRVRQAVSAGDVAAAAAMLGRPYRLHGVVSHGEGRGRQLGFPTANLSAVQTLLPLSGVYAAIAHIDGDTTPAAINIGHSPTVGPERDLTIEAHLLDHHGDCYDATLNLDLIERIRNERSFPSLSALTEQIAADIDQVRRVAERQASCEP